ncbi:hypothetical protein M9M90_17450 [Phenylobacterium sp. LH3H17]|uniref:hypothetical protein n=1 Tax=Phenylobacterium sp. LH3H17 TaxID=2903901 RepID=UPI0020C9E41B|nr:hypothetical protein [Phenylobacterium sp. LH3H17]UTP38988.1 hypothetical protein M9M90_17450 [Phenylobacterium sp. LH3H17]
MDDHAVDEFKKSLDERGEQQVRRILERGAFNPQRTRIAEAWLDELEDTRHARSMRESLQIAKSANAAAWTAAIAAIIAIPIAIVAIVISYLALG